MAHEVTDAAFDAEVLTSSEPVLVDFWAPWCGPCRMVAPVVEEIGQRYAGRVKVVKMNVDDNERTAAAYNIRSIPTLLIFHEGRVVDGVIGAVPASELTKRIDAVLSRNGTGK
jgi:thioredoxin 1